MTSEEEKAVLQPSTDLDLGPSLKLELGIECFLQEPAAMPEEEERSDPLQGSPVKEYVRWIVWRGCKFHTPIWWQELVGIPGIDDFWELAHKIRASYELPQARSRAQIVKNDYLVPPSPKCIHRKAFLPPQDLMFLCQDFRGDNCKRPQPMHRPSSIGQGRLICQCQADHAVWQGVCRS